MDELSNAQLAVLNSLVYMDIDWNGKDGRRLADVIREARADSGWSPGGGLSPAECEDVFRAIENSPSLAQLEIFYKNEIDYKKYSDARVLTFRQGSHPIVVFHGTDGDAEFWDNLAGGYQSDTDAQQRALEYIQLLHEEYGFAHISVTGHSKGGNKAMYAAVRSDYVTDCVVFDAQGFSMEFLNRYENELKAKKDSITLIAPDRSWISALLFPIAGNVIYTSTEGVDKESAKMGALPYHKTSTFYTVDENGNIQLREESTRAVFPDMINLAAEMVSAGCWTLQKGAQLLQAAVSEIISAKPSDGLALGVQIGSFLAAFVPGLSEWTGGILTSAGKITGLENGIDVARLLELAAFGIAADVIAVSMASAGIITVIVRTIAVAALAWTAVRILEDVLPALIQSGMDAAKAAGLAAGTAAAWIAERLADFGRAVAQGFQKAADAAVQLGKASADAAKAVKETAESAVSGFLSGAGVFFRNLQEGVKSWLDGIFGSPEAAIDCAHSLNVTMSRIEEMHRQLSGFCECCGNAKQAAAGAGHAAGRVSAYYSESYVRSCCLDIQNHLKNACKYADAAQQKLEQKRRMLLAAAQAYRNADRQAAGVIRSRG